MTGTSKSGSRRSGRAARRLIPVLAQLLSTHGRGAEASCVELGSGSALAMPKVKEPAAPVPGATGADTASDTLNLLTGLKLLEGGTVSAWEMECDAAIALDACIAGVAVSWSALRKTPP